MPRHLAVLLITLLAISIGTVGGLRVAQAGASEQVDTTALLDSVERFLAERYANFPDRVADLKLDLPALHARTDSSLRAARSNTELRRAIESLLATFQDGHLRVQTARRTSVASSAGEPSPPISARAAVSSVCRTWGYGSARSRSSFTALDGYRAFPRSGLPFERGVFVRDGRKIALLRIDTFGLGPHSWTCTSAWVEWTKRQPDASCDDDCAEELRAEIAQRIADGLRAAVSQLADTGADLLIIDLTGNGGGTEWVSRAVRAISSERIPATRVATIPSRASSSSFTQNAAACDPIRAWRFASAAPCDFRVQRAMDSSDARLDATGAWMGRIAIVIDGGTASAAEQFAANLIDYAGAVSIGARSYGSGCGFTSGNRPLVLRELNLEIVAPNCSRFRKDGSNEVNGIVPSLDAGWRDGDGAKRRAELALQRLLRI